MKGQSRFTAAIEKSWYQPSGWTLLLLPLSWLFTRLIKNRILAKKTTKQAGLSVPIIVVGNISVGGTGKTPLIIGMVKQLQQQGFKPGVISRGFGGSASHYPLRVNADSSVDQVGDEPLLIAQHCPVVVDPDRLAAARCLIGQGNCDLIISDDGLQHYNLPRDIEIVVVDGQRKFGNGHCLPAGPLREPVTRLDSVDMIVVTGGVFHPTQAVPVFSSQIKPKGFRAFDNVQSNSDQPLKGVVHAVAGIGNPERFSATLQQLGYAPILHAYPDHHPFKGDELLFTDSYPVVITAKDAVKIKRNTALKYNNVWVLDIETVPEDAFNNCLYDKLTRLLNPAQ